MIWRYILAFVLSVLVMIGFSECQRRNLQDAQKNKTPSAKTDKGAAGKTGAQIGAQKTTSGDATKTPGGGDATKTTGTGDATLTPQTGWRSTDSLARECLFPHSEMEFGTG